MTDLGELCHVIACCILIARLPLLFFRCYGWRFYPLAVLKILADAAGFAGPLLLHELVGLPAFVSLFVCVCVCE